MNSMNWKFTTLKNEYNLYIFKEKRGNDHVTLYDCDEIKDMETYTSKIGWNVSKQRYPYKDCKDKEIIIGDSDIIGFKSSDSTDNIKHWNARAYLNSPGVTIWPGHIYGIKKSKNGGRPLSRATFRQRRLKRPAAKSRRATRRATRRRRV